MELWELSACIRAYEHGREAKGEESVARCWETAAFTSSAIAGKLKPLENYTGTVGANKSKGKQAPQISKEEFEEKFRRAKEAAGCLSKR